MERYKKRTIVLCLASFLTVVGAFGAENYSNTLVSLRVDTGSRGNVNLTAFTKKPLRTEIKTIKIDNNTFVLTLPDTKSDAAEPDINNFENIESISISTYPYTTESDGCTKIVVKTIGEPKLFASHALYIPSRPKPSLQTSDWQNPDEDYAEEEETSSETVNGDETNSKLNVSKDTTKNVYTPPDYQNIQSSHGSSFEWSIVILCMSLLLFIIGIIYMLSKEKMSSIVGDQNKFDISDKEQKNNKKRKKLRRTINTLDEIYKDKKSFYKTTETDIEKNPNEQNEAENSKPVSDVVVDLDALYKESQMVQAEPLQFNQEYEDDLAILLNSFSADYQNKHNILSENELYQFDDKLYNKIINSKNLTFSDSDINKISQLINVEVSSELNNDLIKYLNTPIIKPPTKTQILENLLSTYSIQQNINFTKEDVDAIKKLMDVELDPEFLKDFTTNPVRTKAVEKAIREEAGQKSHRTSEIITLNVKDMLPDLSLELKKYGNKKIISNAKPKVVYYTEGYEYTKLKVSDELLDISENILSHNDQNEYKPPYQDPIAVSGYEVSTLAIKDELPDLADVKANPQKYQEKPKPKPKVDENALLKSISNVTFKPFYEEVETELNQFENFEVVNPYKDEVKTIPEQQEEVYIQIDQPLFKLQDVEWKSDNNLIKVRNDENANKLLKLIETQQAQRAAKKQAQEDLMEFKKELAASANQKDRKIKQEQTEGSQEVIPKIYNLNGKDVKVLTSVKCNDNCECLLIETNEKSIVLGKIKDKEVILKEYDSVKSNKMYIRQKSKAEPTQYLVKIGLSKFIVNITSDNMEYVMDLC